MSIKENVVNPMFTISGIEKGFKVEDFLEELVRVNYEGSVELQGTVKNQIKVIAKKNNAAIL